MLYNDERLVNNFFYEKVQRLIAFLDLQKAYESSCFVKKVVIKSLSKLHKLADG